ncbi:MAG: tRNA uridine-5-carboxymethylaminomethyl(34) synthesis GTPase MnmE [Lachnospiraceae bacterium]|jgi:tRNA modification GTPase|nr:tRNA uridine-5-carboxymethylaminomethyl(34) synthesis GTPase MnmE [Lachnospiraceae bacterium]
MFNDTIAAISTGMTDAGIGIIRLSGDHAISIGAMVFNGVDLTKAEANTVHYGHIEYDGEIFDEVYALVFRAPKSYTREDVVEFDCHGGVQVLKDILHLLYACGARPAEPGEFTKRAFLNGRIDLTQSESVMDLIHSKSSFERRISLSQLDGKLHNKIADLREIILHEAAFLEAAIDDPEHYSLKGYSRKLQQTVKECIQVIDGLLDSYQTGSILKNGIRTAIVGRPNVGKSSLLNLLSGKEKAIVTDVPGTTRDVIEEQIILNDIPLLIMDTAGIHDTDDYVEKIGVEKSVAALKSSQLILLLLDGSNELTEEDMDIMDSIPDNVPLLVFISKSDLPQILTKNDLPEKFRDSTYNINCKDKDSVLLISNLIYKLFSVGELSDPDAVYLANDRQKYDIEMSKRSLELVLESIKNRMSEDFYSSDLMEAYKYLGYVIGEEVEDDLVDKVFSDFCMGK